MTGAVLEGEHTLSAAQADGYTDENNEVLAVYEFTLDNSEHCEFDGCVSLMLELPEYVPELDGDGAEISGFVAPAWYDEDEDDWIPAICDTGGEKAVVYTNHFSRLGLLKIKDTPVQKYLSISNASISPALSYICADEYKLSKFFGETSEQCLNVLKALQGGSTNQMLAQSSLELMNTYAGLEEGVTYAVIANCLEDASLYDFNKYVSGIGLGIACIQAMYELYEMNDAYSAAKTVGGAALDAVLGEIVKVSLPTPYAIPAAVFCGVIWTWKIFGFDVLGGLETMADDWSVRISASSINEWLKCAEPVYFVNSGTDAGMFQFSGMKDGKSVKTGLDGKYALSYKLISDLWIGNAYENYLFNSAIWKDARLADPDAALEILENYIYAYGSAFFQLSDSDLKLLAERYLYSTEGKGEYTKDDITALYDEMKVQQADPLRGHTADEIRRSYYIENKATFGWITENVRAAVQGKMVRLIRDACKEMNGTVYQLAVKTSDESEVTFDRAFIYGRDGSVWGNSKTEIPFTEVYGNTCKIDITLYSLMYHVNSQAAAVVYSKDGENFDRVTLNLKDELSESGTAYYIIETTSNELIGTWIRIGCDDENYAKNRSYYLKKFVFYEDGTYSLIPGEQWAEDVLTEPEAVPFLDKESLGIHLRGNNFYYNYSVSGDTLYLTFNWGGSTIYGKDVKYTRE